MGLLFFTEGYAQERHICGTSPEALNAIQERLIKNKAALKLKRQQSTSRNREDIFIPIKFHMVAQSNGRGRATDANLLNQMCTINEAFGELGIKFYLKDGVNYLDNGALYDSPTILIVVTQMQNIRDDEAVNVFVVGNAQNPQVEGVGRTLGYYSPSTVQADTDWIVVRQDEIAGGGMTLLHELGHFFSLPHPFNGWDFDPYNPSRHGSPAPESAPNGRLTELADGSNCEVAGDMLCDTPADYLYFSQLNSNTCSYNLPMIDPQGDTLQPDPTLIMGYFLDRCMDRFTPEQVEMMRIDFESEDRAHLRSNPFTPIGIDLPDEPIAESTISPSNEEIVGVVASGDEIILEWGAVEGATSYIVESNIPDFESAIVTEARLPVRVEVGRLYRWRVRPFNDLDFCTPATLSEFRVDMVSSVPNIGAVEEWSIQPNPVLPSSDLFLSLAASQSFEADIRVRNVAGSTLFELPNRTFEIGDNTIPISTDGLNSGLYILSIENEEGVTQRKVVVW